MRGINNFKIKSGSKQRILYMEK